MCADAAQFVSHFPEPAIFDILDLLVCIVQIGARLIERALRRRALNFRFSGFHPVLHRQLRKFFLRQWGLAGARSRQRDR